MPDRNPTADGTASALRSGRTARGWSQSDAARELVALGERRGAPVAAAASLKSLLSRWENGHAVPEPHYRELLAELYGRSPAELGIGGRPGTGSPGTGAERLREAVAAAAVPDSGGLWREQWEMVTRLDDEFGAAGTGDLVPALVEQLDRRRVHALTPYLRTEAARLLTGAAVLAATQALDRGDHDVAWRYAERARAVADRPVTAAVAVATMAAVLVDADDAASAIVLLEHEPAGGPPTAAARIAAALGQARAALGDADATHAAFATAFSAFSAAAPAAPPSGAGRVDVHEPMASVIELADLHRRHGHALTVLGDPASVAPLREALAARPRSVRHRAAVHADLAVALADGHPVEAAEHAREARGLAVRIGSERTP